MTTPIDAMPPGPELDAMVAERVMGWAPVNGSIAFGPGTCKNVAFWLDNENRRVNPGEFHPSTDIADAWRVVEAMARAPFYERDFSLSRVDAARVTVKVSFGLHETVTATTAQHAIALAALKAAADVRGREG